LIEGAVDSLEGETKVYYDAIVSGLRLRIGRHRRTWFYFQEYSIKGKRGTAFRRLGFWPRMTVADARKEALQHAARVAAGRPQPGRRQAITLEAGLADYIASLETRGKKSARFVASLARLHLIPEFGRFTLAELSDTPALLRDHHLRISKAKPVSANRVMSILNAVYRHASRLDRSLPPASPISAVRFNREEPKQSAMPFDQFSAWRERVETLPAIRQAYHRLMLLSGIRGGEAQRLQWFDVNVRARTITLRQRKRGADIEIPMSAAIARELKRVRRSGKPEPNALIFPGARKWNDALAFKSHALRHTFASVAADLNIGELQRRLLMGHSLVGINQSYVTRAVLEGGPGLRAAQRAVSRRIISLLG
jgi:integrase